MSANVLETLKRHPFAHGLEPSHVERLASLARFTHIARDQVIFKEGEMDSRFFLIVEGPVALEISVPRRMLQVQRLGPGDGFGWSAALAGRGKYFQARAIDEVEALEFDGNAVMAACRADPAFGFAFMVRLLDVVSKRLQATRVQLADLHSPVARQAGV
jgi:CRP-like cAMP-binding protein